MKQPLRWGIIWCLAMLLGACNKEQSQTIFLNKRNLTLLPNQTTVQRFANDLGDTLFFFRASLDTSFVALPFNNADYNRMAEGRNAVFRDSTGRYRADFGLFLEATGPELYDVTHVLQNRFSDAGQASELEFLFELTPPQLRKGFFFPQLIWVNDTLENIFISGQPGPGNAFLLYNETAGLVGFQNTDNQQFYRL
jgi:hypothetical protein